MRTNAVSRGSLASAALLTLLCGVPHARAADPIAAGETTETLRLVGLEHPVDILRDHWGIAHIYAQSENDLFFAQGYNVASDRLFQLEMWRRQATGTVSEILGKKELKRDVGNRLFQYRDVDENADAQTKEALRYSQALLAGFHSLRERPGGVRTFR